MATVIKHTYAGPFNVRVRAEITDEVIAPKRRGDKVNPSRMEQVFYNDKRSWMELRLWITTNFYKDARFVTLTYLNEYLPKDKKAAENGPMAKFHRRMRRARKRRGKDWKYIYCTEGYHGTSSSDFLEADDYLEDKRLHHHMIINGAGPEDFDEIRSLWPGGGYVRIEPFDVLDCTALAKYMTKEAREFGRGKPGDRSWKRSMNLTKYRVEYNPLSEDGIDLSPPKRAVDYEAFHEKNPYGYADYVGDQYFLFESTPKIPASYANGRRKKKPPLI